MTLFGLLICAAIFRVGYGVLVRHHLHQGVAMFVGLPVLLGTVVAFATYPRSPIGMVFKVTTLVMCVLAPLVEEGAICIAMAAPLVFGVIGLVALFLYLLNPKVGRGKASCCAALLGLLPLAWEPAQKTPGWEDRRPVEGFSLDDVRRLLESDLVAPFELSRRAAQGMSEEQIEMAANMSSAFTSPPAIAAMQVFSGAIFGLIIGLIAGLFMKRERAIM